MSSVALKNRTRSVCPGHTHTGAILERLGDGNIFSVINMYEQGEWDAASASATSAGPGAAASSTTCASAAAAPTPATPALLYCWHCC